LNSGVDVAGKRGVLLLALAGVLLFAATLWVDTRQNGFPFFYHPDEPDKVDQLITGKWNFHHPLMMLGTAETVKRVFGFPDKEQTLVIMGRWCSAAFAAGGVVCLALLAWRERGWSAFWIVGLLLLTQHQVYELAHYFKEDTSLFFAMSLTFLALHVYHRRPGWGSVLFAGAACGLCVSAKYLGAIMLAPAAVILIAAQRGKRAGGVQWVWFGAGFLAVAALVNFPVFTHFDVFLHSFGRESKLVAEGQPGYTGGQVAIFEYLRIFVLDTTPVVWVLVIAELIAMRKNRDAFAWTIGIFPFAFILLLSCSTKTNDRYFLPITGVLHYLAGLGGVDLPGLLAPKWSARVRPWALAGLALIANGFYLAPYITAFAHDDRTEMLAWIRANVPAGAVIAGEDRADLPNPERKERLAVQPLLTQKVIEARYAADLGATPAEVAAKGINYLVISESDYGLYFRKAATGHLSPSLQRKREFYEELFKEYQPLWQRDRGTGIYLHPGLKIYRLTGG
jgi:4-amino-4-deoxy-L-arabinose transferase-like glycosyltransferase